jgi:hypothetical protein
MIDASAELLQGERVTKRVGHRLEQVDESVIAARIPSDYDGHFNARRWCVVQFSEERSPSIDDNLICASRPASTRQKFEVNKV